MPATLANTFLFILQGSALADLGCGGIIRYTWSQLISVCNSDKIIKIGQYFPKLCSNEKGPVFSDSQCTLLYWNSNILLLLMVAFPFQID